METGVILCVVLVHVVHGLYGDYEDESKGLHRVSSGQEVVDYIAKYGRITVSVVDNLYKVDGYNTMELKLTNTGHQTIASGDWRIYYYALYSTGSKGETLECGLRVCPVDKGLFYFTPVSKLFPGIGPGDTLRCTYHNKKWSVARTDQMPNWYVTSGNAESKTIESTTGEDLSFVGHFISPAQWKTSKEDRYNPYTPEQRYNMHVTSPNTSSVNRLVPAPHNVSVNEGTTLTCTAGNQWVVVYSSKLRFESQFLADALQLPVVHAVPLEKYIVFVSNNSSADVDPESYDLDISRTGGVITITAAHAQGAFHGVQTLVSLAERDGGVIPEMRIKDKPRFRYRGLMLDTARNFKPKAWVLRLLDAMSMFKLNHLHLHLTDDEGWRLEIPGLPELTQIGSQRCHTDDDLCLVPVLGSGPTNKTVGSGFYSVKDYVDILKYAADRHITVVPEIDLPGHSTSAIRAMSFPESKLASENHQHLVDSTLLSDIESNKTCGETFHRFNAINPCMNSTYTFVEKVVDELIWLHRDIMPLKTVHIGGDEVASGVWDLSPACQLLMGTKKLDTHELQTMFFKRVTEILSSRELDIGVWDDGVYSNGKPYPLTYVSTNVQVYPWDNRWETSNAKRAYEFADAGYKVVLTLATHLYFSHTYEPDPEERGVTWATRFIDTKKVFGMMPDDIYSNADVTSAGEPVDINIMCQHNKCPKTSKPQNIIGMQACLWSETTRTEDQLQYMLFPKLLAFAERAWHKASWENISDVTSRDTARSDDWEQFVRALGSHELLRLERRGIQFRVAPPGATMNRTMLAVNTQFPNHFVEISTDNGASWSIVSEQTHLPPGTNNFKLKTRSPVLKRTSRIIELQIPKTSSTVTFKTGTMTFMVFLFCNKIFLQFSL